MTLCYNSLPLSGLRKMVSGEQNQNLQRLERLTQLSRSMNSFQDLESLLYSITETARELIHCEMCLVLLYEQETELLKFFAGPLNKMDALKRLRLPIDQSLEGTVYKRAKPLLLNNALDHPHLDPQVEKELGLSIYNMIAAPLTFRGEAIGVIEAVNKPLGAHFNNEDLSVLETLASQTTVAILSHLLFEEVKLAFDQLEALERMKTDFLAITSHELRTPVGLVLGHAFHLSEQVDDPQQKKEIDVIVRSANRLKDIVDDITNANDVQAGNTNLYHNLLSVNHLLTRVTSSFTDAARQREVTLKVRLLDNDLTVDADEEKITVALNNLVNNALTFTDPGGHVLVSAELLPGHVQVSVLDDGIGIPARDLPKVFDRFFQVQSHLTRRHGGMGLGLSVAKAMVELHNGQIWVESREGKGSRFTFLLPIKTSPPSPKKVAPFL